MFLWGVAVLDIDSYTDHNKGPDPPKHLAKVLRYIPFIDLNHTT